MAHVIAAPPAPPAPVAAPVVGHFAAPFGAAEDAALARAVAASRDAATGLINWRRMNELVLGGSFPELGARVTSPMSKVLCKRWWVNHPEDMPHRERRVR